MYEKYLNERERESGKERHEDAKKDKRGLIVEQKDTVNE